MVILKSPKHVFWEALLVAAVIFILGFLIGSVFEKQRVDEMQNFYTSSEISMVDGLALNFLSNIDKLDCGSLVNATILSANNIYAEAKTLEKYESSGKIDQSIKLVHRRYDLLRTFLWMNTLKINEKCPSYDFSAIVYLYAYEEKDLTKKAEQSVWSKVLLEVKNIQGDKLILIPLATDLNLGSLNSLTSQFNVTNSPAVILPNGKILYEPVSANEIIALLK